MVSFKSLLAFAGAVSAIDFVEWCQHNGLVSHFNQFLHTDTALQNAIMNAPEVTVFLPTDAAWSRWQSNANYSAETFAADSQTFMYMAITGSYKIQDLINMQGQYLPTLIQGQSVYVSTRGVAPHLTPIISSGTGFNHNSTAGVIDFDFNIDNGHVQLVDSVFQLPTPVFNRANRNMNQPSGGWVTRIPHSAFISAGVIVTVTTSMLF